MWNSSEEPLKSIPHQTPSLNHSLLWVFAAVGPCGHLTSGSKEGGRHQGHPPHAPSLTHRLLWLCAAVGPCGHLTSGLKERGRPKATPASRTITPKTSASASRACAFGPLLPSLIGSDSFRS